MARAVMERSEGLGVAEVTDFEALPGNGLSARFAGPEGGQLLTGGSYKFISSKTAVPEDMAAKAEALASEGKTPLLFTLDGKLAGIIAVADTIKEDSAQAIKELQGMGIEVVMLTGDNERTAAAIGKQAGVDRVIAGVLPNGKASVIEELKAEGSAAMVGDGINDAPALTVADTGIAIGAALLYATYTRICSGPSSTTRSAYRSRSAFTAWQ